MRVILVGTTDERAGLRTRLAPGMSVAGEFPSLAAARASGIPVEAYLVASRSDPGEALGVVQERVTPRETQVLELLAQGLPNKRIAARLGISDQTVKFHVSSLTGKLGASNRTDLVRCAVRRGLISF